MCECNLGYVILYMVDDHFHEKTTTYMQREWNLTYDTLDYLIRLFCAWNLLLALAKLENLLVQVIDWEIQHVLHGVIQLADKYFFKPILQVTLFHQSSNEVSILIELLIFSHNFSWNVPSRHKTLSKRGRHGWLVEYCFPLRKATYLQTHH